MAEGKQNFPYFWENSVRTSYFSKNTQTVFWKSYVIEKKLYETNSVKYLEI